MIDIIDEVDEKEAEANRKFGPHEEKAIISLAFDVPDSFIHIGGHLEPEYFRDYPTRIIYSLIDFHYNKYGTVISRDLCRDIILKDLTADDSYEEILETIDRKSNPREIPIIRDTLIDFAKEKAFEKLYDEESIDAYQRGDYELLERIVEDARKIQPISIRGSKFFETIEELFIEDLEEKLTTGFTRLDAYLNDGGPTRKEVVCWMAPTGVGKSIMLVNSAAECIRRRLNVLFVTLEMSETKVKKRFAGTFTNIPIRQHMNKKDAVREKLLKIKRNYESELYVFEFPSNEITIDVIRAVLDQIRRIDNTNIDVVVIDYLELMQSRNSEANKRDYDRQKSVATEFLAFSKKENVLVFTASQTNRSGNEAQDSKSPKVIDLNKVAESYGKTMPLDYIITINQTKDEYESGRQEEGNPESAVTNAQCRFYIAKNRNGPKFKTINVRINYETMKANQEEFF